MQFNKKLNINFNYQLVLIYRVFILLILYTLARLGFFYCNIEHFPDMTLPRFLRIMQGGLKFDISAIFYVNLLYFFLYLLPIPARTTSTYQKILKYIFVIFNGIALAANVGDFFYFDFILKRATSEVFMFAKEGNILILFKSFLIDYYIGIIFWIVLLIIMFLSYNLIKPEEKRQPKNKKFFISASAWMLISIYFTVIGIRGGFTGTTRPIAINNAGAYTEKTLEMAIVLNTPFSIIRTLGSKKLKEKNYFPQNELEKIYTPIHRYQADSTKVFKPTNIVVLVMESFSKEYIGYYNKDLDNGTYKGYTPFLDSLISQSKRYKYSFANGRKSIEALPSLTASIPSLVNPYVTSVYSTNQITGLGTLLKKKNYQTAFFHGAPNGSMGFDAFVNLAGYDQYYGMTEYGNDDDFDGSWGIWDEEFMQFMANKINTLQQPFLTTFFSLSSHGPFVIPERYEGKWEAGPIDYCITIRYADMALRKFFKTAEKMPWFDNTIFVLSADHAATPWHDKYKTFTGSFEIPIIFYQHNNPDLQGLDTTHVMQQIDVMPTLLNYLNYDEDYIAFGNDLFNDETEKFAINYINGTYQFIKGEYALHFRDEKVVGFYNYVQDPLLNNNLKDSNIPLKQEMLTKLKAIIQTYNDRMINNNLILEED